MLGGLVRDGSQRHVRERKLTRELNTSNGEILSSAGLDTALYCQGLTVGELSLEDATMDIIA